MALGWDIYLYESATGDRKAFTTRDLAMQSAETSFAKLEGDVTFKFTSVLTTTVLFAGVPVATITTVPVYEKPTHL